MMTFEKLKNRSLGQVEGQKKFTYVTPPLFSDGKKDIVPVLVENPGKPPARYYRVGDGATMYPSVTTVLGEFEKEVLDVWHGRVGEQNAKATTEKAAAQGTRFHQMMESYFKNETIILDNVQPLHKAFFTGSLPILNRIDNIVGVEVPLYSHTLGLAGRCDLIAEFDGVLSVIDFKTSKKRKQEKWIQHYFEQACAYSAMYEHITKTVIDQIVVIVMVEGEKTGQLFVRHAPDYIYPLLEKVSKFHAKYQHPQVV